MKGLRAILIFSPCRTDIFDGEAEGCSGLLHDPRRFIRIDVSLITSALVS